MKKILWIVVVVLLLFFSSVKVYATDEYIEETKQIIDNAYNRAVQILSENIDVSNTECCSSSLIERYCPCGLSGTLESENCDFVYVSISNFYDEYGLPHRIDTTQCKECGIIKEVEDYYVDGGDVYEYHRDYTIYFDKYDVLGSYKSILQYVPK